jgi:formiminotetrahydrofolate cyclodeaminase
MAETPAQRAGTTHASIGSQPLGEVLGDIARKSPAPGGGAVASVAGALAAALGGMVLAYSRGRKDLAEHAEIHDALAEFCATAASGLLRLADADAMAYAELNAIQRLEPGDPDRESLPDAAQRCVDVPLGVQLICISLLEAFVKLAPIANPWLLSDLKIAAILAEAAVRASDCNVEVNAPTLGRTVSPEAERDAQAKSLLAVERAAESLRSVESLIDA